MLKHEHFSCMFYFEGQYKHIYRIEFVPTTVPSSLKQLLRMKIGWLLPLEIWEEKQKEHLADFWWFPCCFPTNFLENDVKNKYIRMNTGYWHETILGVSLKRTRLPANSPGFLVHHFLCCLALHHSSSIPHFAHSCPAAGRKVELLPSPIKAFPPELEKMTAFSLILNSNNVKSSLFNLYFYLYPRAMYNAHGENRYMVSGNCLSCFFMYFP